MFLIYHIYHYHTYLYVSYILSLSLPHISLCFLCMIFITATYILYFMTTTMIVTESEVFKVHQGAFPNSLSEVQLKDWLSQGCKTIFLCNLQLTLTGRMNEHEALVHVKFSFFPATPSLPPLQCRISPPSCLFTCLDRASPILSNVCSPNCKP